jgi:catechol 2,3-dioxygenase-like lactoylglutathione lyase family enzyme
MKRLASVCIITADVPRLRDFYRAVLQVEPQGDDTFTAFVMDGLALSLYDVRGMELLAPGSMRNAGTGNVTLEVEVDDVDAEYERVLALGVPIVKPPQTHPWGRRSVWLRDPDGTIVNFNAPANIPNI